MDKKTSNDINYYSKGSGKPLYFVHGFPDCAENFESQINFFSQNGYKVIAPFLPGYTENDNELDTYQTLRISEIMIDFIESVSGKEKIYIYGHDWGARIVNGIAQLRPDLIH